MPENPAGTDHLTTGGNTKYYGVKMSVHQIGFQEVLFAAHLREKLPEKWSCSAFSRTVWIERRLIDVVGKNLK